MSDQAIVSSAPADLISLRDETARQIEDLKQIACSLRGSFIEAGKLDPVAAHLFIFAEDLLTQQRKMVRQLRELQRAMFSSTTQI